MEVGLLLWTRCCVSLTEYTTFTKVFFLVFFLPDSPQVKMQGHPVGFVACWFNELTGTRFACKQLERELTGCRGSRDSSSIVWTICLKVELCNLVSFTVVSKNDFISGGKCSAYVGILTYKHSNLNSYGIK